MTGSDTKPEWTFRPILQKGEKVSNPQPSREFERAGHVHSICGDPLQNSLDARLDQDAPVVFEMGIWDGEHCLSQEEAASYFGPELRRHIKAVYDEDQTSKIDTFEEPLAFITLEDFNALGLKGKIDVFTLPWRGISEAELKEINDNRFLWMNRAQNATSDAQDRRGSWGEGKFTLEWASRLGAQIAWSIRAGETEPRQVLMGQTTLRRHSIRNPGKGYGSVDKNGVVDLWSPSAPANFAPYGYFSTTRFSDPPEDYAPLPVVDEGYISQFREQFRMVRDDEPGTSILIPHPHEVIRKPSALARGIIARWLLAIHAGEVVVNIRKNGELVHSLSKETIRSEVKALNWDVEEEKVGIGNERNPACRTVEQWIGILDLLDWAEDPPEEATFHIDEAGGSHMPTWATPFWDTPDIERSLERLREAFESGEPVKITAHPSVNSEKDGIQDGEFDVIMRKATKEHSTQVYAREAMGVPLMEDVEGAIAVVHCHESALLNLLRHSEGPAHLKWAQGARRVIPSGGYWKRGKGTVLYVNDSVKHLLNLMKPPIEEQEHAVSLFSISIFDGEVPPPDGPDGPVEPPVIIPPPPREPDVCRIPSKGYQGSVRVRHNPDFVITGKTITVNLAYETSKGKPWTKYSELDFSASDLAVSSKGAAMVGVVPKPTPQHGLVYTFDITSDKWKIDFSGFDGKRDVHCDVKRVA